MLRNVFRQSVGCALASLLGASGCYGSSSDVGAQPGASSRAGAGRGAMPVVEAPKAVPSGQAAASDREGPSTPKSAPEESVPMAGAAAPTTENDEPSSIPPEQRQDHPSQASPVTVTCP